jgi:hypothetical protein
MLHRPTHKSARLPDGQPPVLLVIVDTEEEFDWTRPFDRASTGTGAIAAQPLIHERVYDRLGIVPTYVIDYPVASTEAAYTVMRDLMRAGRAEIGTHLHPWVSPPYTEAVSTFNSYAGNLPRELEYEKLRVLTETIRDNLGRAPVTFKAGRYGVGPHTADSIAALGYRVDASVVPYTAFTADGGPDFRAFREDPYWFQAGGRTLLELPATTGYCGLLRGAGPHIHDAGGRRRARHAAPDHGAAPRGLPGVLDDLSQPLARAGPHAVRAHCGRPGTLHRRDRTLLHLVPGGVRRRVHERVGAVRRTAGAAQRRLRGPRRGFAGGLSAAWRSARPSSSTPPPAAGIPRPGLTRCARNSTRRA